MIGSSRLAAVVVAVLSTGCTAASTPTSATVSSTSFTSTTLALETTAPTNYLGLAPSVAEYLDELLSLIQENLWNSSEVDWEQTRTRLFTYADGAETTTDAYLAIRGILQEIDRHAFLMTPEEVEDFESGGENEEPIVVDQPEPHLGLVVVPGFGGDLGPVADDWAASAQRAIAEVASETCGWIVDLRPNTGGNMWPMLAALGPLLDGELVGAFTAPDSTSTPWRYEGGVAYEGDSPAAIVSQPIPELGPGPVAVLIGFQTASSGEAIVVALHGRARTRFFGEATAGFTSSNTAFELSDGAVLYLPVSLLTDRTGLVYPGNTPIAPDQETEPTETMNAAIDWISGFPACASD